MRHADLAQPSNDAGFLAGVYCLLEFDSSSSSLTLAK